MKLDEYVMGDSKNNEILQSIYIGDLTVLLLDTKGLNPTREGFKNLLAIDKLNDIIWIAELPSNNHIYSSYWTIELKNNDLYALSGSFLCNIDPKTGTILKEKFVK